jgi:hypothetical protein
MKRFVYQWLVATKNAEAFDGLGRNGRSAFTGLYRLSIYY